MGQESYFVLCVTEYKVIQQTIFLNKINLIEIFLKRTDE